MADSNKIVIEVDADTSQFSVKMGNVTQTLQKSGQTGKSAFEGIGGSVLLFNQALELGSKLLEGVHAALELIENSEAFGNQRLALDAMAASFGLTTKQVDLLLKTIQKASGDTVEIAEAQKMAFELLNANVEAKNIPTLVKYAETLAELHPQIGGVTNAVHLFTDAIMTGSARALGHYITKLKDVQGPAEVQSAIMARARLDAEENTVAYSNFGKKTTTAMSEAWDATKRFFGGEFKSAAIRVAGDDVEIAKEKLQKYNEQLKNLESAEKAGAKGVAIAANSISTEYLPIQEARLKLDKMIAEQTAIVTKATKEETQEIKNASKELEGTKTKVIIDPAVQAKQRIAANVEMYAELQKDEKAYVKNSENIDKGFYAAKKAQIDSEFQYKLRLLNSDITKQKNYTQEYLKLEKKRVNDSNALLKLNESQNARTSRNMAIGWHNAMKQMHDEHASFAKFTQKLAVQSQQVMSSSITKMAKEHKLAMDEMLFAFLGMIGESLIQKGTADLLMSIFPPNPAGLGAGAAEIALGATLVGVGGSSGGAGSAGSTSGAIGSDMMGQQALTAPSASQMKDKQATIVINGDLLDSPGTATHLQELIRKNSDVTDFAIIAQGKQY